MASFTEKVKAFAEIARGAFWWVLIIGIVVACLALARACGAEKTARSELLRYQQEAAAEKADLIVVYGAREGELREKLQELTDRSSQFEEELARAQAELKARPVMVVRASTGPVRVERPPELPKDGEESHEDGRTCLLYPGDEGQIEVSQVVLQTDQNMRQLVGFGEAIRTSPEPRIRLFAGTFRSEVTEARAEPIQVRSSPGWGAGGGLGADTDGRLLLSATVASPPFLRDHFEALLTATGASDRFALQAQLIYRR